MSRSDEKQDKQRSAPVAPARAAARAPAASAPAANVTSCEAALARVLQLAQSLAQDTRETRKALPSGRSRQREDEPPTVETDREEARERLTAALRELDPETALKLRTLMVAGRDGRTIGAVNVNLTMSDTEAVFAAMAADSGENGPLLIDYLRRGHAMACAAGINLETPLTDWQSQGTNNLDERAWLSFGKQLAASHPADWKCMGIIDPSTRELGKLYVKLGDHAWWSFQAVLDRPTLAGVEKERRALTKRRLKAVSTTTLEAFTQQLGGARGRALRRAGRAICARVGYAGA
jgi:hypothetical protein